MWGGGSDELANGRYFLNMCCFYTMDFDMAQMPARRLAGWVAQRFAFQFKVA